MPSCGACSRGGPIRTRLLGQFLDAEEQKLLDELATEMLSPEGVALLKQRLNEHIRKAARVPKAAPKPQAAQIAKKSAEIEQVRALMKAGTLSQAVAQAAIAHAQEEIQAMERVQPEFTAGLFRRFNWHDCSNHSVSRPAM